MRCGKGEVGCYIYILVMVIIKFIVFFLPPKTYCFRSVRACTNLSFVSNPKPLF